VRGGRLPEQGRGAYLWRTIEAPAARPVAMPAGARAYGARLYAALNELDREGWDWIAVEEPPSSPEWHAIHDRLQRASREQ
jgi:L-threonylcarbamoyladenylate synthase